MNLSLLAGIILMTAWIVLVCFAHIATGPVHLLYAGAWILFARRVLGGAPAFRS